jgi:hypothetical protein
MKSLHQYDTTQKLLELLFEGWGWLVALFAFVVIIPLSLWFAWRHPSSSVESILETILCCVWGWAFVSLWRFQRASRKLGLSGEGRLALLSGPRPTDPDELGLWKAVRDFLFAIIATGVCIASMPVADWLTGR